MKLHTLKIKNQYYMEVSWGFKKAELRKNDREYEVGDLIHFVNTNGNDFIHESSNVYQITHILKGVPEYGLNEDYVILSIKKIGGQL